MEASTIALMLLGIGLMAWRLVQGRRMHNRSAVDELLGPLPESDARETELTDSAESGRATPASGAGRPTAAYNTASDLGATAPQQWSGAGARAQFADVASTSLGALDRLTDRRGTKLGIAAGAGAAVGLGLLVMSRRRARRRRRIERLRRSARTVLRLTTAALLNARDRVSTLPDGLPIDLDRRTSTGGGVALLATLGLLAAIRGRHERRTRATEAAEALQLAAAAADTASRRRWRGFRGRTVALAARMDDVAEPALRRQFDRVSGWSQAILTAMVAVGLLVVRAVRRRGHVGVAAPF